MQTNSQDFNKIQCANSIFSRIHTVCIISTDIVKVNRNRKNQAWFYLYDSAIMISHEAIRGGRYHGTGIQSPASCPMTIAPFFVPCKKIFRLFPETGLICKNTKFFDATHAKYRETDEK